MAKLPNNSQKNEGSEGNFERVGGTNGESNDTFKNNNGRVDFPMFYSLQHNNSGLVTGIEIVYTAFLELLEMLGLRRYDLTTKYTFVALKDNVLNEIEKPKIKDKFREYLGSLPEKIKSSEKGAKPFPKEFLINKIYKGIGVYFSDDKLTLLPSINNTPFKTHTKDKAYFYYQNGFVEVSANGIELKDYNELDGLIWERQKLGREFMPTKNDESTVHQFSVFGRFLEHITAISTLSEEENRQRLKSLMTLIGYFMHDYAPSDIKLLNLTDSSLSTKNEGGTGKSLIFKAINEIINLGVIQGKNFKPDHEFKFQKIKLDDIACLLDDVKPDFKLEWLYNETTYGIDVIKKGKSPFTKKMKMAITSNKPIRVEGASDKRRIIEFELANFFSADYTPQEHFGHSFFSDWQSEEWNHFDNIMLACVQLYLKCGIVKTEAVTLNERKLQNETSIEFLEFMQDLNVEFDKWYDKAELLKSFLEDNPEQEKYVNKRRFTEWLCKYGKYTKSVEFDEVEDQKRPQVEGKKVYLIRFRKK